MKTQLITTLFLALGLSACTQMNPQPLDLSQAIKDAETKADNKTLAEQYEEAANEMQLKVNENKKLLSQSESNGYLFGRQAEDIKEHSYALMKVYERDAATDRKMAEMYRQLARKDHKSSF